MDRATVPGPAPIASQSTPADAETLKKIRNLLPHAAPYRYLEVGSYLGASLLPHLMDPACETAISIDKRPTRQYDERNKFYSYEGVTTARMVGLLAAHAGPEAMSKLRTHDGTAGDLDLSAYAGTIDLAFIDGEHTTSAVFDDFLAVRRLMKPSSLIVFHDRLVVFQALMNVESLLRHSGQPFERAFLPESVCVVAIGDVAERARPWFAAETFSRSTVEAASREYLIRQTVKNYAIRCLRSALGIRRRDAAHAGSSPVA